MKFSQINFEQQQNHLKNVSRTFALTIPLLPDELIDYVSNAYLLCRIADTIEDDPIATGPKKCSWLQEFYSFCSNDFSDDMQLLSLHKQGCQLVKEGAKESEYALLEDMPGVVARTRNFPPKIRSILSKGVSILSIGMAKSILGVKISDLKDVDRYCYFVAGVVGELLAALFSEFNHSIDRNSLMNLSVSFGEGLQLTNILKDRAEDKKRNVSFLPPCPEDDYENMVRSYIQICQGHLDDALDFICLLPVKEYGVRFFCLLNIAMATATLKVISKADVNSDEKLKITRNKVKFLYCICKVSARSNLLTCTLFKWLSLGIKRTRRNPVKLRNSVSCWNKSISDIL
ncbi:MAG: squalene/phytoene synthase family protein [Succinivibrio sp.]